MNFSTIKFHKKNSWNGRFLANHSSAQLTLTPMDDKHSDLVAGGVTGVEPLQLLVQPSSYFSKISLGSALNPPAKIPKFSMASM